jgi:hypothetical protein
VSDLPAVTVVRYRVGPPDCDPMAAMDAIYIEQRLQRDGTGLWAVTHRGFTLNTDGEWEYEPQPSSRDDDFLARTRWRTVWDARSAAAKAEVPRASRGGASR